MFGNVGIATKFIKVRAVWYNSLVQDCSISSALVMGILQSCTKPSFTCISHAILKCQCEARWECAFIIFMFVLLYWHYHAAKPAEHKIVQYPLTVMCIYRHPKVSVGTIYECALSLKTCFSRKCVLFSVKGSPTHHDQFDGSCVWLRMIRTLLSVAFCDGLYTLDFACLLTSRWRCISGCCYCLSGMLAVNPVNIPIWLGMTKWD